MESLVHRLDPVRVWLGVVLSLVIVLVGGSLLFPRHVYDSFIWRYFWGPVIADAQAVSTTGCAVRENGQITVHFSGAECAEAVGVVAHPGYTTTSTVSYAIILILALVGVVLLLRKLDVGTEPAFFYALVPFMFFGGALRVVEDANATLFRSTGEMILSLPWIGFFISPLIYFTVFFLGLGTLLGCLWAERRNLVTRHEYPLAVIGTIFFVITLGFLGYLAATTDDMGLYLIVPIITLGGATVITGIVWVGLERYWPAVNEGTGYMGALVIWGHTIDGVANVLSLDWAHVIGLPGGYLPKHVVNRLIIDITSTIQPPELSATIGTAWPFLFVKIAVAVMVVWIFEPELFEDSPRYAILLLVTILAVGLGPGTRDFLRATFGI